MSFFPEQNENTNTTTQKKNIARSPRPGYNSRFYIAQKGGKNMVVFLDRYADLNSDQLNFLDAFGFPQRSRFVQTNKDKSKVEVESGFSFYEHTIPHNGKFFQTPCSQHTKMTAKMRIGLVNQLAISGNADYQSVMSNIGSADADWFLANQLNNDTLDFLVNCAPEAFRNSVRDVYSLPIGAKFDDDGVPCRFCEQDRISKEKAAANGSVGQSTSGRKILRTVVNVGLEYDLKDGTKVKNPLQLLPVGSTFDSLVRDLEAEKRGGKKKAHTGLFGCLVEISRSAKGASSGDSLSWEDSLTPEQVLSYNPNAVFMLDKKTFEAMLSENGYTRYHMLRAAAPNLIRSVEDAINVFVQLFGDGIWLGNTADYRAITFPKSPSYLRNLFGETESKKVTSLNPKSSFPDVDDKDIPF